jgi:hypothetical protein
MSIFAADEVESGRKKHPRFQVRGFRARRLQPASINQSTHCSVNETVEAGLVAALGLSRIPRVYTQCEDCSCVVHLFVHGRFTACIDFSRDRFRKTDRVSTTKWTDHSCFADFERPLRASHPKRFLQILEKERSHYSSMVRQDRRFTWEYYRSGRRRGHAGPARGKFIPAPMHYFMRFTGADGMHAGYLPGHPASHGCVRMPEQYAIAFFNAVSLGTPVTVYGRTPTGRYLGRSRPTFPWRPNRFEDPRFQPRFAPPPPPGWWR